MELSKQCITLEQSRKLLSLGFKKDSYFNFVSTDGRDFDIIEIKEYPDDWSEYGQNYSAYTVSELVEYLPDTIKGYSLYIKKMYGEYIIYYATSFPKFKSNNLSQALGDALIYLIENKYIDVNSEK